ncbi:MAG TPA: VOC family protein [Ignavibacteria bacterium]
MITDNAHIGGVNLRVNDLERSLHFYSHLLGLKQNNSSGNKVSLHSDLKKPYLVKLVEDKNAKILSPKSPGLYHIAIRIPNRKELGRVFIRLFDFKYKFQGFSDHLVSESIYLSDPEGNGIELYADRPKSEWVFKNGQVEMDTIPLNLNVITKEVDSSEEWNGIHPETDIGHIHLKVSNIFQAEKFYSNLLGFNVTNSSYPGALFLSAGGYHHHIGANIWQSRNVPSPPEDSLGLISFSINIPDKDYLAQIGKESSGEGLLISSLESGGLIVKDFDNIKINLTL